MGLGDDGSSLVQAYAGARPGSGSENTQDEAGEAGLDEGLGSPSTLHNGFCSRSRCWWFHYVYFDSNSLPDLEGFTRFEFPTIGHIYDARGQTLKEMASKPARSPDTTKFLPSFATRSSLRRTRTSSHIPELTIRIRPRAVQNQARRFNETPGEDGKSRRGE